MVIAKRLSFIYLLFSNYSFKSNGIVTHLLHLTHDRHLKFGKSLATAMRKEKIAKFILLTATLCTKEL